VDNRQAVEPSEILSVWFAPESRPKWFKPDDAFDAALRRRFEPALEKARADWLGAWLETPEPALAHIILLDQVPRNIYRGTPKAFAWDDLALDLADQAVKAGLDAKLGPEERQFLYMPFMHSERLADQERGVALFTALGLEEPLDFMKRHRDVIARFGRFPHRNAILGRESTPEEMAFLEQPGSSF